MHLGRGPWVDLVGPPRRSGKMGPILGREAGKSRTARSVRSRAQPPQDTWGLLSRGPVLCEPFPGGGWEQAKARP